MISASPSPDRVVTIAALQAGLNHSRTGNPGFEANFTCLARQAQAAAQNHPDIIVFPEYAITGWPYPTEAEINHLAQPVPGAGEWFRRYQTLARELRIPLVGWLLESANGKLYNTAFVLDQEGEFTGKYRKVQANLGEQTWWGWSQGEAFQVIELNGVRYGFSICSDMWFPETVRCNELLGADVVLHLSIADDMGHILPTRAFDSHLPVVASIFNGGSYAVDAAGKLLGKLPPEEPGWITFQLQPFQTQLQSKYGGLWNPKRGSQNLRNLPAYQPLIDPARRQPWTEVFFDSQGNRQSRAQLLDRFGGRYDAHDPALYHQKLVSFAAPWTSPFRVDPARPHHLVNREGQHLFILNRTAWAYFGCQDPCAVLERAQQTGCNVIRVALEGQPYFSELGIDLWPWKGTRENPDWSNFNERYWQQVEERVRLAGEYGIGLDLVLYMKLHPEAGEIELQRTYWAYTLERLAKYANILTWEIANEYTANAEFQAAAGRYFKQHDPHRRPVCSSDGTTDDAIWPDADWMDLAINHTCTSSTAQHDLHSWYLALARNTRSHGKPAFCNESGREKRHRNDDGIHRRKQGWLWCAAGGFWTFHAWDGCEGIDTFKALDYHAPGEESLKPMADFFRSIPFWDLDPNETTLAVQNPNLTGAVLAKPDRSLVVAYLCTLLTGARLIDGAAWLRLPDGVYRLSFLSPLTLQVVEVREVASPGLRGRLPVSLPDFTDDLLVIIQRVEARERTHIPGTL